MRYAVMARDERFRLLRGRFARLALAVAGSFLGWYFLYVALSAFARGLMARPVAGNINVALVLGVLQFVSTFALAWCYARYASDSLDPVAAALRDEADAPAAIRGAPRRSALHPGAADEPDFADDSPETPETPRATEPDPLPEGGRNVRLSRPTRVIEPMSTQPVPRSAVPRQPGTPEGPPGPQRDRAVPKQVNGRPKAPRQDKGPDEEALPVPQGRPDHVPAPPGGKSAEPGPAVDPVPAGAAAGGAADAGAGVNGTAHAGTAVNGAVHINGVARDEGTPLAGPVAAEPAA
ncbi:DUF485 domain-containing protein, partial [Spirillospora sp. NPDC049652]